MSPDDAGWHRLSLVDATNAAAPPAWAFWRIKAPALHGHCNGAAKQVHSAKRIPLKNRLANFRRPAGFRG
ncbi:MAG: hypothetical protein DME25_01160, partial [Verrucomicrobia bacterium]